MARSVRKDRANKKSIQVVMIVTLLFIVILSVRILQVRKENDALISNQAALQESFKAEQEKNDELTEKKDRPLTKEEIIEIARQRFGLLFPNEILFIPEK